MSAASPFLLGQSRVGPQANAASSLQPTSAQSGRPAERPDLTASCPSRFRLSRHPGAMRPSIKSNCEDWPSTQPDSSLAASGRSVPSGGGGGLRRRRRARAHRAVGRGCGEEPSRRVEIPGGRASLPCSEEWIGAVPQTAHHRRVHPTRAAGRCSVVVSRRALRLRICVVAAPVSPRRPHPVLRSRE